MNKVIKISLIIQKYFTQGLKNSIIKHIDNFTQGKRRIIMENDKNVKKPGWSLLKPKTSEENETTVEMVETEDQVSSKNLFEKVEEKAPRGLFGGNRVETGSTEVKLSTINEDVMITGDVKASGNIEVYGTIIGNVECGDLVIKGTGKIEGDVSSKDLMVLSSEFKGNINCSNNVTIDKNAVIYGDVNAENIKCEGKVNGNVNVTQFLDLRSTAVINGNCTLDTISIEKGGMINGTLKNQK